MVRHGAQQAVDATIVSPLTRAGGPHPGACVHPTGGLSMALPDANAERERAPPKTALLLVVGFFGFRGFPRLRQHIGSDCLQSSVLPTSVQLCGPLRAPHG